MCAPALALAALLAAAACGPAAGRGSRPALTVPPDVVMLVMDTVRADRCSLDGYARPTTPHLERFARSATTYAQAWSPARWTVPAHGSLFTGLLPRGHGARPSHDSNLREDVPTLAERLRAAGYATGAFVSNPALALDPGLLRGFDTVVRRYGLERPFEERGPLAEEIHASARAWVRDTGRRGRPFFLFINDIDAHSPFQPPLAEQRRFRSPGVTEADLASGRAYSAEDALRHDFGGRPLGAARLAAISDLYDAEIAALDASVGRLLDDLDASGALANAIVVITSDHGEYLGAHGLVDHMQGVHADVLRVPLVIRAPGRLEAGRRVDDIVRLEDVAPTVLEVCGLDGTAGMDGRSLLADVPGRVARGESAPHPLVINAALSVAPREVVFAHLRASRSVQQGTWQLIENEDGSVELYDLALDRLGLRDVAASEPRTVARLRALIDRRE